MRERAKSDVLSDRRRMPGGARRAPLYARSYVNEVTSPAGPLNSFAPRLRPGVRGPAWRLGDPRPACTSAPLPQRRRKIKGSQSPLPPALPASCVSPPYVYFTIMDFCNSRANPLLGTGGHDNEGSGWYLGGQAFLYCEAVFVWCGHPRARVRWPRWRASPAAGVRFL